MFIKKLFTIFCAMLLSLTIIPLNGVWTLDANAALQAVWPVEPEFTEITTKFDENRNTGGLYGGHNGIDIPADANSDIYAPIDGVCVSSGWMGDYGNLIVLLHENLGIYTFYAHCTKSAVTAGQEVKAGDVIGYVGCTGNSYGNHLHFGNPGTPYIFVCKCVEFLFTTGYQISCMEKAVKPRQNSKQNKHITKPENRRHYKA